MIADGAAPPDRYKCVDRAAEKAARKLTPGALARMLLDDQRDRRNWLDMIADTYGGRFEWNGVSVLWYPDEDTATGMEKTA